MIKNDIKATANSVNVLEINILINPRGSQLLPRVYEILVILASKYMGLMGDSWASVRDSALILASVAAPSN